VADFGLSEIKESTCMYTKLMMDDTRTVWWFRGSCWSKWSSELSLSLKYPFKVDIYSLGVACYEILTGCVPFYNSKLKKLQKRVKDGLRPYIPEQCPEQLSTLVWTCYHPNPEQPLFPDIYGTLAYMCLSCSSHLTRMFIDFGSWWRAKVHQGLKWC
jgi:serine/threonine protein kinase